MEPLIKTGEYSIEDLQYFISTVLCNYTECKIKFYNIFETEPTMFISSILADSEKLCIITSCEKIDTHILDGFVDIFDYCLLIEDRLKALKSKCDGEIKIEVFPLSGIIDDNDEEPTLNINMQDRIIEYNINYETLKENGISISNFKDVKKAFDEFVEDPNKMTMIVRFSVKNDYIDAAMAFQLIVDKCISFSSINLKYTICRPDLKMCPFIKTSFSTVNVSERDTEFMNCIHILKDYCRKVSDNKYRIDMFV